MMRRIGMALALMGAVLLGACDGGSDNPLVGSWKMVPEKGNALSEGIGFLMQNQTLIFTEDSMITAGEATKVTYEAEGDRIVVYPEGSSNRGTVYLVLGEDRIANELPMGQRVIFQRVEQ